MEPVEPTPEAERSLAPAQVAAAVSVAQRISENIRRAVKVRDEQLSNVIVSLVAEGHILVEDYPGVGKTALAATRRPDQVLIGFAAEHGEGALAHARSKLDRKGLDAVVLNDVSDPSIGLDSAENEVVIVTAEGDRHVPKAAKADVAGAILDMVLSDRSSTPLKVPR